MEDASKRIALITGANKGIGFEVSRQLGLAGCIVLVGSRTTNLGEEAALKLRSIDIEARFIEIDLRRRETIATASMLIATDFGRLDILVNNAGIMDTADGPPSTANVEAVQRIMETNFLGTLSVTQAMLPHLRNAKAARIVNVSSSLGSLALHGDPEWEFASAKLIGYSASKAALNMLTVQLAYELRDTQIKVNAVNPGFTATDMNEHRGYQTVEEGAAEAIRLALLPTHGPSGRFFTTGGTEPW
jgi:NAD(P)-dependent dehydrogenase (short-subunit alcohol dehydrogenase family)